MTGFGSGTASAEAHSITVEIRSVNHRYQDVRVRTPPELSDHLFFVEQLARKRLGRGRHDVSVSCSWPQQSDVELDTPRARAIFHKLSQLRDELSPGSPLSVGELLRVPDLLRSGNPRQESPLRELLAQAVGAAADDLDAMRGAEGAALAAELRRLSELIAQARDRIQGRAPEILEATRARLTRRLQRLLEGCEVEIDRGRLEFELAMLADRSDVTEELVRLQSHIEQFSALLDAEQSPGRRLGFLLQEMGREVNTIGSKSQDTEVAYLVVDLKSEIERLREQVQNVE